MADHWAGIEAVNSRRCHGVPLACAIQASTPHGAAKHECKSGGRCIFAPERPANSTDDQQEKPHGA